MNLKMLKETAYLFSMGRIEWGREFSTKAAQSHSLKINRVQSV